MKTTWGIDRRISLTNVIQLIAVICFGVTFYNQVNNSQAKNEDRFAAYAEERKAWNAQLIELQKVQNQTLLEITKLSDHENYLTDTIKDLSSIIKEKGASK